jgi:hypothetical protein
MGQEREMFKFGLMTVVAFSIGTGMAFAEECKGSPNPYSGTKIGFSFCVGVARAAAKLTGENADFMYTDAMEKFAGETDNRCTNFMQTGGDVKGTIATGQLGLMTRLTTNQAEGIQLIQACNDLIAANQPN